MTAMQVGWVAPSDNEVPALAIVADPAPGGSRPQTRHTAGCERAIAWAANLEFAARVSTSAPHVCSSTICRSSAVLGCASLFGRIASIIGTTIGMFTPAVLQSGLVIVRAQPFWHKDADYPFVPCLLCGWLASTAAR